MSKIIVPATSANMGPGFDSIGIAVNLFLEVEILEETDSWIVEHSFGIDTPNDEKNLIVETALNINKKLIPHRLKVTSKIPFARGLGSSSSALVAGLYLARELGTEISDDEIFKHAIKLEGHPDNVAPAIFGGEVIAGDNKKFRVDINPDYVGIAVIPNRELSTEYSRSIMPSEYSKENAVSENVFGNLLTASLLTNDWDSVISLVNTDAYHEPYRARLVPELQIIRDVLGSYNAGVYLSGAGPTVMIILKSSEKDLILGTLNNADLGDAKIIPIEFINEGVVIK
jgi:homoserine kinase